jgi:hypothetical protein
MENLTERFKVVGCLAPVDKAGNAWVGKPINTAIYSQVTFLVYLGAEDSTGTVTVEKGTTSSLGTAIAFNYQIASAGAAAYSELDGTLTAVASTGFALGGTDDNKIIAITVNASELGTSSWVGVKVGASGSANLVTIIALCRARYAQAAPLTAIA